MPSEEKPSQIKFEKPSMPLQAGTIEPQTQGTVEEIKREKVTMRVGPTNPTSTKPEVTPPPNAAPKITINPPSQPQQPPSPRPIQPLAEKQRTDAIAKAVCGNKGHHLKTFTVRTAAPTKDDPAAVAEVKMILCRQCGATLSQVRGA